MKSPRSLRMTISVLTRVWRWVWVQQRKGNDVRERSSHRMRRPLCESPHQDRNQAVLRWEEVSKGLGEQGYENISYRNGLRTRGKSKKDRYPSSFWTHSRMIFSVVSSSNMDESWRKNVGRMCDWMVWWRVFFRWKFQSFVTLSEPKKVSVGLTKIGKSKKKWNKRWITFVIQKKVHCIFQLGHAWSWQLYIVC